jgi:hypothetical protein
MREVSSAKPSQISLSLAAEAPSNLVEPNRLNLTLLADVKPLESPAKPALQFVELPAYLAGDFRETFPGVQTPLGKWDIVAELAEAGENDDSMMIDEAEIMRTVFKLPRVSEPVLIILDDSWPNDDSFVEAKKFFCDALADLWNNVVRGNPGDPTVSSVLLTKIAGHTRKKYRPRCPDSSPCSKREGRP